MGFKRIDLENWSRKEFYLHFINEVVCTYSMNVELDITALQGQRLQPAMLWLLTSVVNEMEEFRTQLAPEGPGIFADMHPAYTIFNGENKNFSAIWTEYSPDYGEFLRRYNADVQAYCTSTLFAPKPGKPANCFDVSMLPWVRFTGFNINVYDAGKYLLPIFTMGRVFEREGRRYLPLAMQVHHAVCDGYHAAQFVERLQQKIDAFPGT